MMHVRRWRYALLLLVPVLLSLALVQAEAQTQPAAGKAKVDRLVMGLITPYLDYMRPWINGTADHNIQHDPTFEWLVEVAPDGQYKPWLAESWEMAKDGRSWRFKLQKGVQFHHGYGEFTAKDLVHTHALWCDEKYPGRKDPPATAYRPVSVRSTRSKWSTTTRWSCTVRTSASIRCFTTPVPRMS